jgi:hypothetical protein
MPLTEREGTHYTVTCSGPCQRAADSVCCRRLFGVQAADYAAQELRARGWHVDGRGKREERWYCPKCRSRNL